LDELREIAEPRGGGVMARTRLGRLSPGTRDVVLTLGATVAGVVITLIALEVAGDYVNFRRDRVLIVLVGLAVTLLALPARRAAVAAGALAGTWIVGWAAFTTIPDDLFIDTPVDQAAGGAAYYGTPYVPQQLAGVLLMVIVLVTSIGGAVVARRRLSSGEDEKLQPSAGRPALWAGVVAAAIGVGLVALSAFPNLPALALSDPIAPYKANTTIATWDLSNLLTWLWLIDDGAVPMRDFFYPYGQTWVFNLFPLGPLWGWLANCGTLALGSWALWRLSPREGRVVRLVLCALTLVLLGIWMGIAWRYAVPFVLALTYAATGPGAHRRLTWGHLLLAAAALDAALWGIDTLGYGVVGMSFVLLGELLSRRVSPRPLVPLLRRLAVDALALLPVLLVPLLWVVQGSFDGNARFAFEPRGVSATGAAGQNMLGALRQFIGLKPTYEMLSVLVAALLVAAGCAHAVLGGRRGATSARLLLAAGGCMFAVLLKHLVRPQGDIMFLIPILALAWAAILVWQVRRWALAAAIGALATTFVWTLERSDVVDGYLSSLRRTPARVVDSIELVGKTDRIAAIDRRAFSRENLPRWPVEVAATTMLRQQMARESDDSFAVLGDLPYLYIYFKERPPYHVDLYDASKRDEQEAMVDDLEEADPNLILWRRDFAQDTVPQAVRNPIVLDWVVKHYVPVRKGAFDVLRRRRPGEAPNPNYWHTRLGEPLSLGYVPAASGGEDADSCDGGAGCNAYAVVRGEPHQRDEQIGFTVSGHGRSFGVILLGRPRQTEYAVRLDRLWFAPFVGARPVVATGLPGYSVRLELHRSGDDLW
jgi:hypothetical protein